MGKIVIIEEKADKMLEKLELMKEGLCEIMECFEESKDSYKDSYREPEDEDEWDDEYEVKRRRGLRTSARRSMRRGSMSSSRY